MKDFDWTKAFDFKRETFRLQALPEYRVDHEAEDLGQFLAGEPLPERGSVPWLNQMASTIRAGKQWVNVHIVPERVTPYFRYILDWWYPYWDRQGADVRFVLPNVAPSIRAELREDFYLFDDSKVILIEYGEDGRYLGADYLNDSARLPEYQRMRELAVTNSVPLREYLRILRVG